MSYKHHQHHRDKNHKTIADTLRGAGYFVVEGREVDLIVVSRQNTVLLEIKTDDGRFYLSQLEFLATNPGFSAVAKTDEQALNAMKFPEVFCFTEKQKRCILQIVHRYKAKTKDKNPRIGCDVFEKELANLIG